MNLELVEQRDMVRREAVGFDVVLGPVVVECETGRLWLTEQNGGGDVVLEAGDRFEAGRQGLLVVEALSERATFRMRRPALGAIARRLRALSGWLLRLT